MACISLNNGSWLESTPSKIRVRVRIYQPMSNRLSTAQIRNLTRKVIRNRMPLQMQRASYCAVALDLPLDARAKIVRKYVYCSPNHLQNMSAVAVVLITSLAVAYQMWAPAHLLVSSVEMGSLAGTGLS